jgi:hypothetical protein
MYRSRASLRFSCFLALAGLGLGTDVVAAKPKPKDVIEIELREVQGGKPAADSRELTVPVKGEISGWLELFGESRLCRSKSSPTRDELIVFELECRVDDRGGSVIFELQLEGVFTVDEPTLLGEIEVREGQRLRVVATRR